MQAAIDMCVEFQAEPLKRFVCRVSLVEPVFSQLKLHPVLFFSLFQFYILFYTRFAIASLFSILLSSIWLNQGSILLCQVYEAV